MENFNEILKNYDTQNAKADKGKLQIHLVPTEIIRNIARIRMYGDEKYHTPYNWVTVEKERYKDALMRHLLSYLDDENSIDEESGYPHLWHAACNIAFLCEMERKDWEKIKNELISRDPKLKKQLEGKENKL